MNKIQTWTYRGASALLFIASFVFFAFFYSEHLEYQEEYQLFLFTRSYFTDLAFVPGGMSAWIARFFTQFFLFSVPGALIVAAFITGTQLLCSFVIGEKTLLSRVCSFIPAMILWVSLCREYSLLVASVGITMALAFCLLCRAFRSDTLSGTAFVVLTPLVWWICGPAALVFVLSAAGTRKWWLVLASLAVFLVLPVAVRPCVSLNLCDLYFGRFLGKDPEHSSCYEIAAISVAAVYVLIFSFKLKAGTSVCWSILVLSFIAVCVGTGLSSDFRFEEELKYSHCVRNGEWDKIISMADRKTPLDKMSISCLNLALAMKGKLADDMFRYVQAGPEGLVPPYEKLHVSNMFISDVYYHIGLTSPSQRHAFEAKEAIPSMEKSSRIYRRLALTNCINRQYATSQKYLDDLSKTLFHRKWAREFNPESTEIKRLRSWGYRDKDFAFIEKNLLNELGVLYQDNNENTLAFQYAAALALLCRNLDAFKAITSMRSFNNVPRTYQEAFLIVWIQNHSDFNGLPDFISTKVLNRFKKFLEASNTMSDVEYLFKQYHDTYWFYYYYDVVS